MKIVLVAIDEHMASAWDKHCGSIDNVSVHRGSILDLECHAVVSPANSFGFMDGGIDLIYSQRFGWHVQERLQKVIRETHHGELLVGTAEIIQTDDAAIPFVIAAPTMRVPTVLTDTVNPYLAARAALLLVKHGFFATGAHAGRRVSEVVSTVAFPGLGTGVGRIGPHTCAQQVRAAIEDVLLGSRPFPDSWSEASECISGYTRIGYAISKCDSHGVLRDVQSVDVAAEYWGEAKLTAASPLPYYRCEFQWGTQYDARMQHFWKA